MSIHKMKNLSVRSVKLALALVVPLGLISCGNSSPTRPVSAKSYPVYMGALGTKGAIALYPASGSDSSLTLPVYVNSEPSLAADGSAMYVPGIVSTVIVDMDSLHVTPVPYDDGGEGCTVSPDGNLVAIGGPALDILSTSDYSLVYRQSAKVSSPSFSSDSKYLYAVFENTGHLPPYGVLQVSIVTPATVITRFPVQYGALVQVLPSNDRNRLYLVTQVYQSNAEFSVYDLQRDSLIFHKLLATGDGSIAKTRDGRYVFAAAGSCMNCSPVKPIYVYSTAANRIVDSIETRGILEPGGADYHFGFNRLSTTPDSRWLVGISSVYGTAIVVDISQMKVTARVDYSASFFQGLNWICAQPGI